MKRNHISYVSIVNSLQLMEDGIKYCFLNDHTNARLLWYSISNMLRNGYIWFIINRYDMGFD